MKPRVGPQPLVAPVRIANPAAPKVRRAPDAQTPDLRPTEIRVGLGEVCVVSRPGDVLVAYGVGSCIILCAWDPGRQLGGMAHIVLPASPGATGPLDGRYADVAVPALLEKLAATGARRRALVAKIAGGAALLAPAGVARPVGESNVEATRAALAREGVAIRASDTGGRQGRTVRFDVTTGEVTVKTLGRDELVL